jgi:putative tryptophan/tyrosine transport system substrate-binding protein
MRRREFIAFIGGVAAWPMVARAQQAPLPVIGFLSSGSAKGFQSLVTAFRQGLSQAGYVEGQNLAIEYRWADGDYEKLPRLAADLVGRRVGAVFAGGPPAVLAAKAATTTTYRIHKRRQSCRARFRVQSQPARWECDWSEFFGQRARCQAVRVAA